MNSKQTDDNEKKTALEKFLPKIRTDKAPDPTQTEIDAAVNNMFTGNSQSDVNADNDNSILTIDSIQTVSATVTETTNPTIPKRIGNRQRKESLEEYRQLFLTVPKLDDRKPVFVSREVRDRLDEIVRKLGGRRMSVSGFIENLARHHLELYREDLEAWKRL